MSNTSRTPGKRCSEWVCVCRLEDPESEADPSCCGSPTPCASRMHARAEIIDAANGAREVIRPAHLSMISRLKVRSVSHSPQSLPRHHGKTALRTTRGDLWRGGRRILSTMRQAIHYVRTRCHCGDRPPARQHGRYPRSAGQYRPPPPSPFPLPPPLPRWLVNLPDSRQYRDRARTRPIFWNARHRMRAAPLDIWPPPRDAYGRWRRGRGRIRHV